MTVSAAPSPTSDQVLPSTENHIAACLNLSHELRTPANAILGHVELLLTGAAGPISVEMRASLGEIQKAALAMHTQLGKLVRLAESVPMPIADRTVDRPSANE